MENNLLGMTAGLISIVGFVPYIIGILRKKVIPSRVTWTIWTLIGTLLLLGYISVSGEINASMWVPVCYVIGPGLIMLLSFYYGEGNYGLVDIVSLILAFISIILWMSTGIPVITLIANIIADFLGALPTIYKTYLRPETESPTAWGFFLAGNGLNLFAIPEINFETFIYPFYLFFIALVVFTLIFRKKWITTSNK